MRKRSRSEDDSNDPNVAAHGVLQVVVAKFEDPKETRISDLERLCREAAEFATAGGLPQRVVAALRSAGRGQLIPKTLLPITAAEDFPNEPPAVALGRLGGLKGGHARAASMTARQRRNSAVKAAQARWGTDRKRKQK